MPGRAALLWMFLAACPALAIDGFLPAATTAGAAGFGLRILGTGFVPYERFFWQAPGQAAPVELAVVFIDSSAYVATIPASLIAAPGTARIAEMDVDGTVYAPRNYTINPRPQITAATLPAGRAGAPYGATFAATGGTPPLVWSAAPATVPAGLTLSVGGALAGTPTVAGSFNLGVQIRDAAGVTDQRVFPLTIDPPPPVGSLRVSRASLAFSALERGDDPPHQSLVVTSSTGAPLRFAVATDAPWWVLFTPRSAVTPARIAVDVNPRQLAAASYTANLRITAEGAAPLTVPIALNVAAAPPELGVFPKVVRLAARDQGPDEDELLFVRNAGGGGPIDFSVSLPRPIPWIVSITPQQGTASPNAPTPVRIRVSPGAVKPGGYRTIVRVTSNAGEVDVPVAFFVAPATPALALHPRGVHFESRHTAGTALVRQVSILNRGAEPLNWTASVFQGGEWLRLNRTGGTATPGAPGLLRITVNESGLAPGVYHGLVVVSSAQAHNSPLYLPVVLNLLDAASAPRVGLSPAGLVFVAIQGQPPPPPKTLDIHASSVEPVAYQASSYTADALGWLSVANTSGTAATQRPGTGTVSVNHANLAPAVYTGEIAYSFSNADARAATVTLIVLPAGAVPASKQRSATGCNPQRLALTQSGLESNFSSPAGWPAPVTIHLHDDCGSPVTNAQVVLTYSNGDPPQAMSLVDPENGAYSATWIPSAVTASMTITARAASPSLQSIATQLAGAVVANVNPILTPDGVVDNFSFAPGAPLAPGTIAAIFGSGLAAEVRIPGVFPFLTDVGGTRVLIGGVEAPIFYVTPDQVAVQIPVELAPNRQYQALLSFRGALTVPETIALAPVQPSVQALPPARIVAAQHADFSLITAGSPARAGEAIVVYVQGLGLTDPPAASGSPASTQSLAHAVVQPTVTVDGTNAEIIFAGLSPGSVGLHQINLYVPESARTGDLEVVITQDGATSNPGVLPVSR